MGKHRTLTLMQSNLISDGELKAAEFRFYPSVSRLQATAQSSLWVSTGKRVLNCKEMWVFRNTGSCFLLSYSVLRLALKNERPQFSCCFSLVDCTRPLLLVNYSIALWVMLSLTAGFFLTTNSTVAQAKRQYKVSSLLRSVKNCKCEIPTGCRRTAFRVLFYIILSMEMYKM